MRAHGGDGAYVPRGGDPDLRLPAPGQERRNLCGSHPVCGTCHGVPRTHTSEALSSFQKHVSGLELVPESYSPTGSSTDSRHHAPRHRHSRTVLGRHVPQGDAGTETDPPGSGGPPELLGQPRWEGPLLEETVLWGPTAGDPADAPEGPTLRGAGAVAGCGTHLQEGDDAIPGDGLQQARGPCQALQASATGGEEGADDDDPRGRPGQHADDEIALQGLPEPAGRWSGLSNPGLRTKNSPSF